MSRLRWVVLVAWLAWISYTALLTAAFYSEAVHNQRGMHEWVNRYTREHALTVAELREVKEPLKGYLRRESTKEEKAYYQAAMYAQSIAKWRPFRTGVVMWLRWAVQWVFMPVALVAGWQWIRRRSLRGPVAPVSNPPSDGHA